MSALQNRSRNDFSAHQYPYISQSPLLGSPVSPAKASTTTPQRSSNEDFHERPRSRTKRHDNGKLSGRPSRDRLRDVHPRDDMDNETIQSAEPSAKNRSMSAVRNPIPPPNVSIRGEFPSLTHSRQPQSLTCLVTVEITEGNWSPKAEDFPSPHPVARSGSVRDNASTFSVPGSEELEVFESPEELRQGLADLHSRLDNWHGLDFTR